MGVLRLVVSVFFFPSFSLSFFAGSLFFGFDLAWSFLDASMAQDFSDCGFLLLFCGDGPFADTRRCEPGHVRHRRRQSGEAGRYLMKTCPPPTIIHTYIHTYKKHGIRAHLSRSIIGFKKEGALRIRTT